MLTFAQHRPGGDAQIVAHILSEVISGLGDRGVQGVVDGEHLGEVGGEADPRRGHQEHLVIQLGVLGPGADLRGERLRADGGPGAQEPHWAGHTASVEAADRQREAARDPDLSVIERPHRPPRSVVTRHVVIALLHLNVPVPPVLWAQLQLVHHVDAVHDGDHLVEVAQVGRVVRLDAE